MDRFANNVGVLVPHVMLPDADADFSKWAVVACDQYTSQPEYWDEVRRITDGAPTTLDLFLPEVYLGKEDEPQRIACIRANMEKYLSEGILKERPEGFVLVKRTAEGKTRLGLIMCLDLEAYDFRKGSTTLIRATEGTIESRIPPRLRIREGAPVELPHILVLIDDPNRTVIEPIAAKAASLPTLYNTDLMLNGGHIEGSLVSEEEDIRNVLSALEALNDADAFHKKYGDDHAPLLFAMGDGNHSFATAKANWEKIKSTLPEEERANHPARYALVEIENVHDEGIVFEPIHRVVFGMKGEACIRRLCELMKEQNGNAEVVFGSEADGDHVLPFCYADGQGGLTEGVFSVKAPAVQLPVGTLQNAIDALLKETAGAEVDYIHGADVVRSLSAKPDSVGFLLKGMEKSQLFPTVVYDGALPRKTFSMGEANEKRYYLECRLIDRR